MKHGLLTVSFLLFVMQVSAQFNNNISVRLRVTPDEANQKIKLAWPAYNDALKVELYSRNKGEGNFQLIRSRTGTDSGFFNLENIAPGNLTEYAVLKLGLGNRNSLGYIYSAYQLEEIHHNGSILVLVDSALYDSLRSSIEQYEEDLIGSGWQVSRVIVSRSKTAKQVKDIILSYNGLRALALIGHIPVPYSGFYSGSGDWPPPDGHIEGSGNHTGAWAADTYYAELTGSWTDNTVNCTTGHENRLHNIPGDGKFDQSKIPGEVELEVGRIDLTSLNDFQEDEIALHRYYFEKNHNYRLAGFSHPYRAVIDDNFTSYDMVSWAFRSYAPIADTGNIFYNQLNVNADFRNTLMQDHYAFAGASGPGYYNSCSGVINSSQFAADSIKTIIAGLSGSFFGDFDHSDNLLRAAIASKPSILASFWGGIPAWMLHPMALGYSMGYCAKLTMNNDAVYDGNFNGSQRGIHIALMGDPALTLFPFSPASDLTADSIAPKRVQLSWTASADPNVIGYHVYRASHLYGAFERVNLSLVNGNSLTDMNPEPGHNVYMVRAVKKITSPSGSFFHMSQGIFDSTSNTYVPGSITLPVKDIAISVYPNPARDVIHYRFINYDAGTYGVELLNAEGRSVSKFTVSSNAFEMPVSDLPSGIYFLRFTNREMTKMVKWIRE